MEGKHWVDIAKEIHDICELLHWELSPSMYEYDIQINESCPNTGEGIEVDDKEIELTIQKLKMFKQHLPAVHFWVKYNALVAPEALERIQHYCEGFVISNTIPFGDKSSGIEWKKWFKEGKSPLPKRLGKPFEGGLSGSIIFPLLLEKVRYLEDNHPHMKIIAGGGIMKKEDILQLSWCPNVVGIALGTVAVLRPWRVQTLINFANMIFDKRIINKTT